MSKEKTPPYSAEFKERAVKLAIESDQPIAQTARDLGVNENTMHNWISKYHERGKGTSGRTSAEVSSTYCLNLSTRDIIASMIAHQRRIELQKR